MRTVPTWLTRMLPDSRVARRLSIQSVLYAFGDGVFTTGNAVYFTQIVGLSAAQVAVNVSRRSSGSAPPRSASASR